MPLRRRRYDNSDERSNVFKYAFGLSGFIMLIWLTMEVIMISNIDNTANHRNEHNMVFNSNVDIVNLGNTNNNDNKNNNNNNNKIDNKKKDLTNVKEKREQLTNQQQRQKLQIKLFLENKHRELEKEKIEQKKLHEKMSPNFPMPPEIYPKTILQIPDYSDVPTKKNLSFDYRNEYIKSNGCSLTVILMDPRIALAPRLGDVWISLESMASNVNRKTTCVVLQTSECIVYNDRNLLTSLIQSKSLPLTLEMIHRGNVRVSIINPQKYKMKNCHNFFSPSNAFMNIQYWGPSEFKEEDSDMVLMIQNDSVFCHYMDIDLWREFAFVGGPWPPEANMHNNPVPEDGTCNALPRFWNQWTKPAQQKTFESRWKAGNITAYKPPAPIPVIPSFPLDTYDVKQFINIFPNKNELCTNLNGPLGNGGFSLRSRKWMRRSIATCPHVHYSGLKVNPLCQVYENIPEDLYFATVLRALHAPLPTAFEASLFAAEMIFPNHAIQYYGPHSIEEQLPIVKKRWGEKYTTFFDGEDVTVEEKYKRMSKNGLIIPIGLHKPWWYHDIFLMLSPHFKNNCPYFEWMLIGRGWNAAG